MTNERAIEILNPEHPAHREHYDSIEVADEACRMGIEALEKQLPRKPTRAEASWLSRLYICPSCDRFIERHEQSHGNIDIPYCKWCGQALDWSDYNA